MPPSVEGAVKVTTAPPVSLSALTPVAENDVGMFGGNKTIPDAIARTEEVANVETSGTVIYSGVGTGRGCKYC